MPLFAPVRPGRKGHKSWPGLGLNFKFIYRVFRRIRPPLKCKIPPLKIGVVSYNEYKVISYFLHEDFFYFL